MVATQMVPIIPAGFFEPAEALTAIIVAGINCTQHVLRTRNVLMALVEVSFVYSAFGVPSWL